MCPVFTNTAAVSSTDKARLCGNVEDQQSLTTTILAASEALTITKTGSPPEVCAGGTVTYLLKIRNTSAASRTVDLTDTMIIVPSGTILSGDISTTPAATSVTAKENGLEIKWTNTSIPGKNEPGNPHAAEGYYEKTFTITLTTNCSMVGTISDSAVMQLQGSTIPSQVVQTLVKAVVDLSIEKTKVSPEEPIYVGDTIQYNIAITNNGPCAATGVYVDDTLPATGTIVPDPNWVLVSGTTYRHLIGNLASGETKNITIKVIPEAPTTP